MDIKSSIPTWVLSELFDGGLPKTDEYLARNLCKESFASMTNDDDFEKKIEELKAAKYIIFTTKESEDYKKVPIPPSILPGITPNYKMQEITRKHTGYVITTKGIMAFRKQIISPVDKILLHIDELSAIQGSEYGEIIKEIKSNSKNIAQYVIGKCIDNAPLFLKFLEYCVHELSKENIF